MASMIPIVVSSGPFGRLFGRGLAAVLLGLVIAFAIGCSSDSGPAATGCTSDTECPGLQLCQAGRCVDVVSKCSTDEDCPSGQTCLPDGSCKADVECLNDEGCCEGGQSCSLICDNFQCIGTDCSDGETRLCFVECLQGTQTCEQGTWQACDSPAAGTEICGDSIDNDCNGATDEDCNECEPSAVEACETSCGVGQRFCDDDGAWGPCDQPDDCDCEPGQERECNTPCGAGTQACGPDSQWDPCDALLECACEEGDEEVQACGVCGQQTLTCDEDEIWTVGECELIGDCEPGSAKNEACGNCGLGLQGFACDDFCSWQPEGACIYSVTTCIPGEEEEKPCGDCGSRSRECEDDCQWGAWTECMQGCAPGAEKVESCGTCGQGTQTLTCTSECVFDADDCEFPAGSCEPGSFEKQDCPFGCGEQVRTCDDDCEFGEWTVCNGVCEPGKTDTQSCGPSSTLGICEKGTQERTCGDTCQWGGWSAQCIGATFPETEQCGNGIDEDCDGFNDDSNPDAYEPNSTCSGCYVLNTEDSPDVSNESILARMDNDADRLDFFCFYASDSTINVFESLNVSITNQPPGMDNDLYVFHGLTKAEAVANCNEEDAAESSITDGDGSESISIGDSVGTDNGGFYIIEVRHWTGSDSICNASYTLTVDGFN